MFKRSWQRGISILMVSMITLFTFSQPPSSEDSVTLNRIRVILTKARGAPLDTVLKLAKQAHQLADSANLPHSKSQTLYIQAWALLHMGEMQSARSILLSTIPLFEAHKDSQYLPRTYNNLAITYQETGKVDSSLHFYLLSLAIREQQKDTVSIIGSLASISTILSKQNKWQEALQYALSAYNLSETILEYPRQGMILNSLGMIMGEIGDSDASILYHKKALEANRKYKNTRGIVIALTNIGGGYYDRNELDSAVSVLTRAQVEAKDIEDPTIVSPIWLLLGDVSLKQELPQQSLDYFNQAWDIVEAYEDFAQQYYIQKGRTKAHLALKAYRDSYHFALKAKDLAIQLDYKLAEYEIYQLLAKITHNLGKDDEAFKYLQSYTQFHDSINLADLSQRIKSIEATFQDSLKTQEITVLTKRK